MYPVRHASRHALSLLAALLVISLMAAPATAQQDSERQHLTSDDYAQWQSIGATALSPDASWFAWTINLVEGDGWLKLQQTGQDAGDGEQFMHADRPAFSSDNRWLAFRIGVSEEEERKLEAEDERVKHNVGLKELGTARIDTFRNVSRFEFSEDGQFLAMRKYAPEESETRGADLLLRDLDNASNQLIGNVAEYAFNEDSEYLAYLVDAHEQLGNGAHLINLETRATRVLDSEEAVYQDLTWNEEETGLAFLRSLEHDDYEEESHEILAFDDLHAAPHVLDPTAHPGIPDDHRIVEYRSLSWSDDGDRLFFGLQEWTPQQDNAQDEEQDETENHEEQENGEEEESDDPDAHLDPTNIQVWHWQDDPVQPRQGVTHNQRQRSNFLSVWHLDSDNVVQLTDQHEYTSTLTGDQQHAILYDPLPHQPRLRESWNNVYLVDVDTGEREQIMERHEFVQTSPGGDFLLYFRDDNWWSYDISADQHTNLTAEVQHPFYNFNRVTGRENYPAFGSGQWAEDDAWVLLYDEFDVYRAVPDGSSIERITEGRADEIRYRQQRLDFDEPALDAGESFYLSMFGEETKDRGYARVTPNGAVETLIYEPAQISRLTRADDADNYSYMRQTTTESPNFYLTDTGFSQPTALTNTNPQQEDYYWADAELVSFTSARGEDLHGRLLYPADYDPDEQYPMMVYIYETRSQSLHNYSRPTRTSPYNQRRLSSEGYFVFEPDITYELHRPGQSAVESVVPAVEEVLATGMIDEDRIGLTGHSWGGYQTNYIITQTEMFASAVAGAPLTNMVSMYNSVYWNTGSTNANIFEISQGRLPAPWWEDWDSFIETSPIHHMEDAATPLLLMFGTDDGAVDFNQGVELYNTMRRMQKEFAMLVYEGENHSLARRENQLDYATRAMEWHAYHLLGEEPADWIVNGLPYHERPEVQEGQ